MSDYRVTGRVLDAAGLGIPGLRVEAWDADLLCDDRIGSTRTDPAGAFHLAFDESAFSELFLDRSPDLFFKVFRGDHLLRSTAGSIRWNTRAGDIPVTITLKLHLAEGSRGSLIPEESLEVIHAAIRTTAGSDEQQGERYRRTVDALLDRLAPLEMALHDSRAFLAGGTLEGNRLLALLNTLATSTGFSSLGTAFGRPAHEIPGDIDYPQFNWRPRERCLIPVRSFVDMYTAVHRLTELPLPRLSSIDPYIAVLDRLAEATAPLEIVFGAARGVVESRPGARDYFHSAMKLAEAQWPRLGTQGIGVPEGYTGPFPIPGLPEPGLPMLDWCRAEQSDRTAAAVACVQALMADERYEIDDIYNVTKEMSRRGCGGDTVEIRGRHLGTPGSLSYGLGRRPITGILSWSDTAIRFVLPSGFTGDDVYLCVDPQLARCSGLCRLAALGTDHSFTIIYPLTIADFTLAGDVTADPAQPGRFTAEACTRVELRVAVTNADGDPDATARVVNGRDELVWTLGDDSTVELDTGADAEYVLTASNLCNRAMPEVRRIHLDITHRIHVAPVRMRFGSTENVAVRISCPASAPGAGLSARVEDGPIAELTSGVRIAAGERSGQIGLRARRVGVTHLVMEDPAGLYEGARVEIAVVPALAETSTPITKYINEEITLGGGGFVAGATEILFGGRAVPAVVSADGTAASAEVPEWAEDGTVAVQVAVEGRPISSDALPFRVKDPVIERIESHCVHGVPGDPTIVHRGDPIVIGGSGFSRDPALNTAEIYSGARRVSAACTLRAGALECTVPPDAPFTSILVRVRRPGGGTPRSTGGFPLPLFRLPGAFTPVTFGAWPDSVDPVCPGVTIARRLEGGELRFRVDYRGETTIRETSFRLSSGHGGVGLSQYCRVVAMLNYVGEDQRTFDLVIWDVETGESLFRQSVYDRCVSERDPREGVTVHEPQLYVSPDSSIVAIIDSATGVLDGRPACVGRLRFYDLARSTAIGSPRTYPRIYPFQARITPRNDIQFKATSEDLSWTTQEIGS